MEARNNFESYLYQVKSSVDDEKLKDKIEEEDKNTISEKVKELQSWLDGNYNAEADELNSKKSELESIVNPIMSKLSGGGMPAGMPGMPDMPDMSGMPGMGGIPGMPDMSGMANQEPSHEPEISEVD